jgi:sucrose-6-phosphate hydrolase SacC (GH32 family)
MMGFFTSKDLKSWEFQSKIKCFHECPELFELPVDGNENNKKWILYGGSGEYLIGRFDGKKFTTEAGPIQFHYGNCFYASQTFNNIPPEDGRRIQIAWGRVAMPKMPFNQMMLFPVTLTLRTTEEEPRIFAEPIREVSTLHGSKQRWKNQILKPKDNPLSDLSGELWHIRAVLKMGNARETGFIIRETPVIYNIQKQELSCCKKTAPLKSVDGRIRLELLVDRTSIEIFGNNGRMYMPNGVILADKSKSLEIFTKGGNIEIESLEIIELDSAWR